MCDNRPAEGYIHYTCEINKRYSQIYNYDFEFEKIEKTESPNKKFRHPSWGKILVSKKYLEFYERVVYIDTDCIFKNQKISIDEWILKSKDINSLNLTLNDSLIFMNNLPWQFDRPCAGFFVALKSSLEILDSWFSIIDDHADVHHPWEQNPLQYGVVGYKVVNDWMFEERDGQFLRHIGSHSGSENPFRLTYFKNYFEMNIN